MISKRRTARMVRFVSLALVLCCAPCLVSQELRPADGKTHSELLVSTQWLSEHLADPKLVILDVGMSGMASKFGDAHIPGAREFRDEDMAEGSEELLPADRLKANLEAIGISDDSRVVIYSSHWFPMAARLFFTLDYLGFKNATLLDGGIEKWMAEKRPTTSDLTKITRGLLTIHAHPEIVAKIGEVQQLTTAADPHVVLLDARPKGRYEAGHLPGAVDLFWQETLVSRNDLSLKSPDELRKMYAAIGAVPGKKVVSYCEVGEQASYAYFVARYLGYDAQMYDGSYDEWTKQKQPTVKGDSAP